MSVSPKKPALYHGYMVAFYKCPYCRQSFSAYDIEDHINHCFSEHRAAVKRACSIRAKKQKSKREDI